MNKFMFRIHDCNHFDGTPVVNMYEIETDADYDKVSEIHSIAKEFYNSLNENKIVRICMLLKQNKFNCYYRQINFDFSL